jgi:succinyl-CoA synthetase alpha subunit
MAGRFMDDEEMKGMSFGHAGTIVEGKEDTATEKIARLEAAGIPVVERIDEIPDAVKGKLGEAGRSAAVQERPEAEQSTQNAGQDAPRR